MTALPGQFSTLAPYAGWALKTETDRNRKRLASTQAELVAFAQTLLAAAPDITAYLDGLSPEDQKDEENERLMCLLFSLAEVAPAVEAYQNPAVVDGYDSSRFRAQENFKLRPTL
jgi:hypothetical protein